jgi:hypothetical protein
MELLPRHNFQNKFGKADHQNNKIGKNVQQTFEHANFTSFNTQNLSPDPVPAAKNVHEFVFSAL